MRLVLLWCGSLLWSFANFLVRYFAREGSISVPVISVGNIEAGGTGKTPWVIAIAQALVEAKYIPVILSRGYGGGFVRSGRSEISSPSGARQLDPSDWGDEVALIAESVPDAWIGVGTDRLGVFSLIETRWNEETRRRAIVLLDDGLQQWGISHQIDLVLVTSRSPGEVLFRELFLRKLGSPETLWIWTKGEKAPWKWQQRPQVSRFTVPMRARATQRLDGRKVLLVSGVGYPGSVEESLRQLGAQVVRHEILSDHHGLTLVALRALEVEAQRHGAVLVTTAKDSVKWKALGIAESWVSVDLNPETESFCAVRSRVLGALQVQ